MKNKFEIVLNCSLQLLDAMVEPTDDYDAVVCKLRRIRLIMDQNHMALYRLMRGCHNRGEIGNQNNLGEDFLLDHFCIFGGCRPYDLVHAARRRLPTREKKQWRK